MHYLPWQAQCFNKPKKAINALKGKHDTFSFFKIKGFFFYQKKVTPGRTYIK